MTPPPVAPSRLLAPRRPARTRCSGPPHRARVGHGAELWIAILMLAGWGSPAATVLGRVTAPPVRASAAAGPLEVDSRPCGADECATQALRIAPGLGLDGLGSHEGPALSHREARPAPPGRRTSRLPAPGAELHSRALALLTYHATAPPRAA